MIDTLARHPLHGAITTVEELRTFTEHHVVCVLDFMSLLKSLQRDLAGARTPWVPPRDPDAARLITSIVLDEETDRRADGRVQSHFEWYLEAMGELGADTAPILGVLTDLRGGQALDEALRASRLPAPARAFGLATARTLDAPLHVRAAVFLHGREELVPELFLPLVRGLVARGLPCRSLLEYFERHIEVDAGEHAPLAEALLGRLCAGDVTRRQQADAAARAALDARRTLWDALLDVLGARAALAPAMERP